MQEHVFTEHFAVTLTSSNPDPSAAPDFVPASCRRLRPSIDITAPVETVVPAPMPVAISVVSLEVSLTGRIRMLPIVSSEYCWYPRNLLSEFAAWLTAICTSSRA